MQLTRGRRHRTRDEAVARGVAAMRRVAPRAIVLALMALARRWRNRDSRRDRIERAAGAVADAARPSPSAAELAAPPLRQAGVTFAVNGARAAALTAVRRSVIAPLKARARTVVVLAVIGFTAWIALVTLLVLGLTWLT